MQKKKCTKLLLQSKMNSDLYLYNIWFYCSKSSVQIKWYLQTKIAVSYKNDPKRNITCRVRIKIKNNYILQLSSINCHHIFGCIHNGLGQEVL